MRAAVSSPGTSAKLLADFASKRVRERLPAVLHARAQGAVDEGLVAAPAGRVNLPPKPVEDVSVEPNGDARLGPGNRDDRSWHDSRRWAMPTLHAAPLQSSAGELPGEPSGREDFHAVCGVVRALAEVDKESPANPGECSDRPQAGKVGRPRFGRRLHLDGNQLATPVQQEVDLRPSLRRRQ